MNSFAIHIFILVCCCIWLTLVGICVNAFFEVNSMAVEKKLKSSTLSNFMNIYDLFAIKNNWVSGDPKSLTKVQAEGIRLLKKGNTYRALARDVLDIEFQYLGQELSVDAACNLLNVSIKELWDMEFDPNNPFHQENKSVFGDFFWWS